MPRFGTSGLVYVRRLPGRVNFHKKPLQTPLAAKLQHFV